MNRSTLIPTIAALVAIAVAAVSAGYYFGVTRERLDTIEGKLAELNGSLTDTVDMLQGHVNNPHSDRRPDQAVTPNGVGQPGDIFTFANSAPWGKWSDPLYCPTGEVVCGLKQRVEAPIDGDDTAMNAVGFYCCPLKHSSDTPNVD